MIHNLFLVLLTITFWSATGNSNAGVKAGVSRNGIRFEFADNAALSEDQIDIVADLARECGLASVQALRTYNIHPGPDSGIQVLSADIANGREVTNRSINVYYAKWHSRAPVDGEIFKRRGEFWVEKTGVFDARFANISSRRGIIRVRLWDKTPVSLADKVVARIDEGKLRFKDPRIKKVLNDRGFDVSKVVMVGMGKEGKCYVSLDVGPLRSMDLECVFDADGELIVISVSESIS